MRRLTIGLLTLGSVGLVLAGALVWLTATPAGFRWLAGEVAALSGGRIALQGIEGHLFAPLSIRRIVVQTDTRRITVDQARLEWLPRRVWDGRLAIEQLTARRITLEVLKKDTEPLRPPRTLRLPLALEVTQLAVHEIVIKTATARWVINDAQLGVADDGAVYRLHGVSFATSWANLQGGLKLAKDAPFALSGALDIERGGPLRASATLAVRGQLDRIEANLDTHAEGMTLMASGTITPFRAILLPKLLLAGSGIDPSRLKSGAPRGLFAFSGVFEGQPGERFFGTFSLSNAAPGRFDEGRLPLVNVVGAVLGDEATADFSSLEIDLGAGGQLRGNGRWRAGHYTLTLDSPALDLAGLHKRLYPTRIKGTFELAGDSERHQLSGEISDREGQGRFRGVYTAGRIRLETLEAASRGAKLAASGYLDLGGARPFAARFDLAELNPARFGRFPQARLMARGQVEGRLIPALALQTRFELPGGELEGRPLRGKGQLSYVGGGIRGAKLDFDLAGNLVRLAGGFGRPDDRLIWEIDAPALERLRLGLAGRLKSRGSLSGSFTQPRVDLQAEAEGMRLPYGAAAERLTLKLDLQAGTEGRVQGEIDARNLVLSGQTVTSAKLKVDGRRSSHEAWCDARLTDRKGRAWLGNARLQGGLDAHGNWLGQLMAMQVDGPWPLTLRSPASLRLGRDGQGLQNARFAALGGDFEIATLERRGSEIKSQGRLDQLALASVMGLLDRPVPFATDMRLAGDWTLDLGDQLDGHIRLRRVSGDVRTTDPVMKLGLQALNVDLEATAGEVRARLSAESLDAGRLDAQVQSRLVREGWQVVLPRTAPLRFGLNANVPDLRLLRPLIPPGIKADAGLRLDIQGSGTLARPKLDGRIEVAAIRFAMPEEGVFIRDGVLKLKLADDRISVGEGVLSGQDGRIRVQGSASLRNPAAGMQLDFERFAALTRSDRRVWLSGSTRLAYLDGKLLLDGELTANKARIEMPASERAQLSSDVHVSGRAPRPVPVARHLPLRLNLKLNLGDDTRFKGAGLDARLTGQIRLASQEEGLRMEGSIRVAEGQYAAFGQKLDIERGVLSFIGPVANPGLDLLAVRKMPTVTAGVKVSGTVLRPQVSLYSDPLLPDTEKLAWLVLGHGLENGGRQEYALLQAAAGTLLGRNSSGLQQQLADALNIDTLEVRAGEGENLASTVVSVGKRLSSRATVSYEQSLDGLSQVVKVLYRLNSKIRLEAQTGQQSSFDIFYSREFD